jgi:phenylacetate-CoA ligase
MARTANDKGAARRRQRLSASGLAAPRGQPAGIGWPVLQPLSEARALALQYQLEESQWWPAERLLANQLRQAQSLLRHACETVPFYRDRLAEVAFLPPGGLDMEGFRRIPLLTRDEIQAAGDRLASTRLPPGHAPTARATTSGSSGRPIHFLATDVTSTMLAALTMRGHLWHKRDLALKNLSLRPPRANMPEGRPGRWASLARTGPGLIVDMRRPMPETFERFIAEDPAYLQSHPNVIVGLLLRSRETGIKPKSLREARSYGECVDPWMRELCAEVWGVPLVDQYSTEEFGPLALQCPEGTDLHLQAENALVEVLDDAGRPCGPGQRGRVAVTGLNNFATPFIRSVIGDIAEVGPPCACGRGLPVLTRVLGRERSMLRLPDGRRVFPDPYREFARFPAIRQWQITQESPHRLRLRLAASRPLSRDEGIALCQELNRNFGHPFEIAVSYVDEIPREPSGKYVDVRSELDDDAAG